MQTVWDLVCDLNFEKGPKALLFLWPSLHSKLPGILSESGLLGIANSVCVSDQPSIFQGQEFWNRGDAYSKSLHHFHSILIIIGGRIYSLKEAQSTFDYTTLPDTWFILPVDLFLKIESKLLCLSDFKVFPSFQLATMLLPWRRERGWGYVGVKRRQVGGEKESKKW